MLSSRESSECAVPCRIRHIDNANRGKQMLVSSLMLLV
jgi:hypothetical protein